jgi:2'-5' RNA ligase
VRLFLAVTPDEECRRRLVRDTSPLRGIGAVRWVREEFLHATLAFLGDVDERRRDEILRTVGPVVARHATFSSELSGGGAFPDWKRPRVIWIGFRDPGSIGRLGEDVRRACATIGFTADHARFTPHLTLGRVRSQLGRGEQDRLQEALLALAGPYRFTVERVELVQSILGAGGPRHLVIDELRLGKA